MVFVSTLQTNFNLHLWYLRLRMCGPYIYGSILFYGIVIIIKLLFTFNNMQRTAPSMFHVYLHVKDT
jgi:hypothetical protein